MISFVVLLKVPDFNEVFHRVCTIDEELQTDVDQQLIACRSDPSSGALMQHFSTGTLMSLSNADYMCLAPHQTLNTKVIVSHSYYTQFYSLNNSIPPVL
jgi:hypothetical protein